MLCLFIILPCVYHSTIFAHAIQSFYNCIVTLSYPYVIFDHVHLLSNCTTVLFSWVDLPFGFVKKKLEDYFSFYTFFNTYTFHSFTFFHLRTFYSDDLDLYNFFPFAYFFFICMLFIRILLTICILFSYTFHSYTFNSYTFFHLCTFFMVVYFLFAHCSFV